MCVYRDCDDTDTGTDILPIGGGGGKELCMYVYKCILGQEITAGQWTFSEHF